MDGSGIYGDFDRQVYNVVFRAWAGVRDLSFPATSHIMWPRAVFNQCSFVVNGGQNIIYFTEFSWELNKMMYLKHLALRLTYGKWTILGQCCYLYWYLSFNLWFFIVNYVSRLSNICFSNIDEDWSIKRSNKEPAWMAMRKRHDQKVILEDASVPSIWTEYFSA